MAKTKKGEKATLHDRFIHEDEFEAAIARYGVWPSTVWEIRDSTGSGTKVEGYVNIKRALGDSGKTRSHSKASHSYKTSVGKNKAGATTSIFPPKVAQHILNLFCPSPGSNIYDPFAGGGTRAIFAAKAGHLYTGVEIRKDEIDSIYSLCEKHDVSDFVTIIHGDARKRNGLIYNEFDFCYTCPPYWTLEQYEGGDADLSMIQDYDEFIEELWKVVLQTHRMLKSGSLSCWVVGLHRKKDGVDLADLHHDVTSLHRDAGFRHREEIIIYRNNPQAMGRVGNFEKGNHLLVRQHEYCLVFEKP